MDREVACRAVTTALRQGAFRRLAALYVAENLLGWVATVALMAMVYEATQSTTATAVMLICRQVVPGATIWLFASQFERVGARASVSAGFLLQGLSLAGLAAWGYGTELLVLAALSGIAGAVARASLRTSVASSCAAGPELRSANALLNLTMGIAAPIGPAVAAFSIVAVGVDPVLAGSAAVAVLLSLAALRFVAVAPTTDDEQDRGFVSVAERRRSTLSVGTLLALAGVVVCVVSMDEPTLLAFSDEALHSGLEGYGTISMAWGVGMTIGSAAYARLVRIELLVVASFAVAALGVAYVGLGAAPSLVFAAAVSVLGGAANAVAWVATVTAVQEAAAPEHLAKATARLEAIALAAPGLGYLVGAQVAEAGGVRMALIVPGCLVLLVLALTVAAVQISGFRRSALGSRSSLSSEIQGGSA